MRQDTAGTEGLFDALHKSECETWIAVICINIYKLGDRSALIKCVSNDWVVEFSKILFFDRMPAVFLS